MKRDYLLAVLFFGSLWGVSEAGLGGYLYGRHISHASVPLTIVAFLILTVAKKYLPQRWSATFIGSVAMLYKFLNTPFFACHLLAIFLLGFSYDVVLRFFMVRESIKTSDTTAKIALVPFRVLELSRSDFLEMKSKAVFGLVSTYLGYILFALTITYVFRYHYWTAEGLPGIIRYVGISGTLAAFANLFIVPLSFNVGGIIKKKMINPFEFQSRLATNVTSSIILAIWFLGIVRCF